MRPNWVEISRSALRGNLSELKRLLPAPTQVCAVVKADAYGHGAAPCAEILQEAGVRWFAVTCVEEAVLLRHHGIRGRLLILGGFEPEDAQAIWEHKLTPAVWDPSQLEALCAEALPGQSLPVHVKLDTGMARLGIAPAQEERFMATWQRCNALTMEALFTHLSSAEAEAAITESQLERFQAAQHRLIPQLQRSRSERSLTDVAAGPLWHIGNTVASVRFHPGGALARLGLGLYGYVLEHAKSAGENQPGLRPILSWKTRVLSVRDVGTGVPVGYNSPFRTSRPTTIATLAVGYADGYLRRLSNRADVLIRGRRARVIGNISMDLTTVDATGIPGVAVGDEVCLLGGQGEESIDANELARHSSTIAYEVLCGIAARVKRIWID